MLKRKQYRHLDQRLVRMCYNGSYLIRMLKILNKANAKKKKNERFDDLTSLTNDVYIKILKMVSEDYTIGKYVNPPYLFIGKRSCAIRTSKTIRNCKTYGKKSYQRRIKSQLLTSMANFRTDD